MVGVELGAGGRASADPAGPPCCAPRCPGARPVLPRASSLLSVYLSTSGNVQVMSEAKSCSVGHTILVVTEEYTRRSDMALLSRRETLSKSHRAATRYLPLHLHPASISHPRKMPTIARDENGFFSFQCADPGAATYRMRAPKGIRNPGKLSLNLASHGILIPRPGWDVMYQTTS